MSNYNKDSENGQLIWSQRDALVLAKTFPERVYPFNGIRVGESLSELDALLTQTTNQGDDLVDAFQAFCEEHGATGLELQKAVRGADPLAPIPEQLSNLYGWQVWTPSEAYKEREKTVYLVGKMFSLPSLSIVYGAPGCLKSMLLTDLAVCVASGHHWLEPVFENTKPEALATKQNAVLWVDYDNGKLRTETRIAALMRSRNLSEDTELYYTAMATPWLDASQEVEIENLKWRILALKAKLVVIDNLGNVSGGADENSAAMIKILGQFRRLAEETGAAIVLIHHQRKSGNSNRAGDALRGHSSIEAALDLALQVSRDGDSETIEIKSTKTRDVPVYPFGALFSYDYLADSTDLHTARFFGVELEPEENSAQAIDEMIFDVLHGQQLSQTAIIKSVQETLSEATDYKIRERILYHERQGKITHINAKLNNAKLYTIT